MTPKLKKILITIFVLGLLFVLYAIFLKPDPVNTTLIEGREGIPSLRSNDDTRALGNQIAQALLRIEQISLDKSIFSDRIYQSLKDRSQTINDEPIGRPNPFAPLGDISSVSSSVRTRATSTTPQSTIISTSTKATSTSSSVQQRSVPPPSTTPN